MFDQTTTDTATQDVRLADVSPNNDASENVETDSGIRNPSARELSTFESVLDGIWRVLNMLLCFILGMMPLFLFATSEIIVQELFPYYTPVGRFLNDLMDMLLSDMLWVFVILFFVALALSVVMFPVSYGVLDELRRWAFPSKFENPSIFSAAGRAKRREEKRQAELQKSSGPIAAEDKQLTVQEHAAKDTDDKRTWIRRNWESGPAGKAKAIGLVLWLFWFAVGFFTWAMGGTRGSGAVIWVYSWMVTQIVAVGFMLKWAVARFKIARVTRILGKGAPKLIFDILLCAALVAGAGALTWFKIIPKALDIPYILNPADVTFTAGHLDEYEVHFGRQGEIAPNILRGYDSSGNQYSVSITDSEALWGTFKNADGTPREIHAKALPHTGTVIWLENLK